jgi:hypothetical protein
LMDFWAICIQYGVPLRNAGALWHRFCGTAAKRPVIV